MFALIKIKVGKGTFERCKNILVHFNGKEFPSAVKKSKINEKYLKAAKTLFSHTHAHMMMDEVTDCTVHEVFTKTKGCFVEDDLGTMDKKGWSIEQMEKEYAKQMKKKLVKVQKEKGVLDETDATKWTGKRLVKELHKDNSSINWAVFKPHKKLLKPMAFGLGDLSGLRKSFSDKKVQYALVRMAFGAGTFRRSHWIFIHWTGQKMTGIKKMTERAEHNSYQKFMGEKLQPWGMVRAVQTKADVTLDQLILGVRKLVVVDGKDDFEFNSETFMQAVEEDKKIIKTKQEKVKEAKKKQQQKVEQDRQGWEVLDSVMLVAHDLGDLNWILLKP